MTVHLLNKIKNLLGLLPSFPAPFLPFLLCYSAAVMFCCGAIVLQFDCAVVVQCYCAVVLLCYCFAVPLCCSSFVLQY